MNPREGQRFVHKKQQDLFALINNGNILPVGAEKLIEEAIQEYGQAFDPNFRVEDGIEDMDTEFIVEIPHGSSDGDIIGGTIQLLGIRFEAKNLSQEIIPAFFVPVVVRFDSNPQTPIYPDKLRYAGIDRNGNSNPVVFMFAIPETLVGQTATIMASAADGRYQSSINFLVK